MHIDFIEVANFRKLLAVRIDIAEKSTVFVGANNSGKSSAMVALRRFLIDDGAFSINDFTLTHWPKLDALGSSWEEEKEGETPTEFDWQEVLPHLDVWLKVPDEQLHFVQKILPTLDWDGSAIGVRLRYEPKDLEAFKREYLNARNAVKIVMAAAEVDHEAGANQFSLWPKSMIEFLSKRLRTTFGVKAYLLDPSKLELPDDGEAKPQVLPEGSEPIVGDPFKGLIRIDEISAQRGLGWPGSPQSDDQGAEQSARVGKRLSTQLRSYYSQHLDPFDQPEPKDILALQALHQAQLAFGEQLANSFEVALNELESIGYPGLTDPKLRLAADVRALDALNHGSSVQYEVPTHLAEAGFINRLPEDTNGLGYQNLVSMVFALMSFRDKWMRVGKASKTSAAEEAGIPPLHLVLVEEPEAHLHAQVQQVFISHAYDILRNNKEMLGDSKSFCTQLIVSTHSSHLAHEAEFVSLRYFRRMPVKTVKGSVPISHVVNLSKIFGAEDETTRFVKRYLKVTHCDLFFADGAIIVEGPAERIVVPHMVCHQEDYAYLRRCYLTWLEIGGSHAHRLRALLTKLGLNTLIITDIDAKDAENKSVVPQRGAGLLTRNQTLKTWVPEEESLDTLLDTAEANLASEANAVGVRVAYQQPVKVKYKSATEAEALANTFEDALVYQNLEFFEAMAGAGLAGQLRAAIQSSADISELSAKVKDALSKGGKAEFAMNLLESENLDRLVLPAYIDSGLRWLITQLKRKEDDVAGKLPIVEVVVDSPDAAQNIQAGPA